MLTLSLLGLSEGVTGNCVGRSWLVSLPASCGQVLGSSLGVGDVNGLVLGENCRSSRGCTCLWASCPASCDNQGVFGKQPQGQEGQSGEMAQSKR